MVRNRFAAFAFIAIVISVAGCSKPPIITPPPVTPNPPVVTQPPVTNPPPVTTQPPVTTPPPVTPPPVTNTTPPVTPPPTQVPVRGPNDVWIQGFTFAPQVLTVPVGTTVTWTNKDSDPHDVTSDPRGLFAQNLPGLGGTFSYKFDNAGTYNYVCTIHPGMSGSIVAK